MIELVMKKKSSRSSSSKKKIILLSTLIFALGIFMLFFNILMKNPSTLSNNKGIEENPVQVTESIPESKTEDTQKQNEVTDSTIERPVIDAPSVPIEVPIEKTKDGVLIFIFDDGGHKLSQSQEFVNLPFPVTIAVLPQLADSVKTADLVRNSGNELFLHQPMQAMNLNLDPGPSAIFPDMTTGDAAIVLRNNLSSLGPVKGVNNHEGSLITSDRNLMGAILDVCIDEGVLFLDSRTTAQTVVPMVALERGLTVPQRDVFLDNSQDENEIRKMIQAGLDIADKKGYAIMIGHVTSPKLASILEEMYDNLIAQGYTFSTPSKLNY